VMAPVPISWVGVGGRSRGGMCGAARVEAAGASLKGVLAWCGVSGRARVRLGKANRGSITRGLRRAAI
jgi:hypothetical protein